MRHLLIIVAAAALLAPLASIAQDRGGWRGGGGRGYERYAAADRDRGDERGRGRGDDRGRYDRRGDDRGRYDAPRDDGRGRYAPPYDPRGEFRRSDPRAAAPAYQAAPPRGARSWRQGQYLPPMYRGSVLRDPGRYRLRAPPPGYDWIGVGPDIYLMQRGTGMVLDTIPGGY